MVAHMVRRTVMIMQMDMERFVLLFHALFLVDCVVGQVDGSRYGADIFHVLLGVAVQATVDACKREHSGANNEC